MSNIEDIQKQLKYISKRTGLSYSNNEVFTLYCENENYWDFMKETFFQFCDMKQIYERLDNDGRRYLFNINYDRYVATNFIPKSDMKVENK